MGGGVVEKERKKNVDRKKKREPGVRRGAEVAVRRSAYVSGVWCLYEWRTASQE